MGKNVFVHLRFVIVAVFPFQHGQGSYRCFELQPSCGPSYVGPWPWVWVMCFVLVMLYVSIGCCYASYLCVAALRLSPSHTWKSFIFFQTRRKNWNPSSSSSSVLLELASSTQLARAFRLAASWHFESMIPLFASMWFLRSPRSAKERRSNLTKRPLCGVPLWECVVLLGLM